MSIEKEFDLEITGDVEEKDPREWNFFDFLLCPFKKSFRYLKRTLNLNKETLKTPTFYVFSTGVVLILLTYAGFYNGIVYKSDEFFKVFSLFAPLATGIVMALFYELSSFYDFVVLSHIVLTIWSGFYLWKKYGSEELTIFDKITIVWTSVSSICIIFILIVMACGGGSSNKEKD